MYKAKAQVANVTYCWHREIDEFEGFRERTCEAGQAGGDGRSP